VALLDVLGLCMSFGGLKAVWDLTFSVQEGEVLGMIGPNGSGKTTVFNLITGIYRPKRGRILFRDRPINGLPPYRITPLGISRTFQNIRLFQNMTVEENVLVGMHRRLAGPLRAARRGEKNPAARRAWALEQAQELLSFTGLAGKNHDLAANLSYGEQRRLELARALAAAPAILLLDEPTAGMNPQEAKGMIKLIEAIHRRGITIFIVEHNMKVLMGVSDRVIVLDAGEQIAEGPPQVIQRNPEVIKAYLGTEKA
jgi:branched-chain amino acid transport system ATP-binding protein